MNANATAKGLTVFLVIAFGGAWATWGAMWLLGALDTGPIGQLGVVAGAFAPALAAIVARRIAREGFADAGLRPNLRRGWPNYALAWLLPLPVVGAIFALATALGIQTVEAGVPAALVPGTLLAALVSAPLFWGEEFGWRGYLQPRLYGGRSLPGAIGTGLLWGVFHYPLILAGFEGYEDRALGLAIFPVSTILLSIIFGWLRARGGSIWPTCLAHAATNAVGGGLTAALFLGGGHFALTSYTGVLGWLPLGAACVAVVVARRRLVTQAAALDPLPR